MDSINLHQQLLIDQYLADQLPPQKESQFKAALKIPEFAEAVALQSDLQDFLLAAPQRSPLKAVFEKIESEQRKGH